MKRLIKAVLLASLVIAGCQSSSSLPDFQTANPRQGLYYEIFVRSFADSDGDGIGDLNGITEKLDYLVDLGVEGIWLMPIHPSPSYHGYDVTDYYAIHPDYGTMADFENLVFAANTRGIEIMIDFVVNHTSSQHPWFIAAQQGTAPYNNYYVKKGTSFYNYFGGMMPDLNLRNPAVIEEIYDAADFWLGKGVTGFRLDAAKHFFTYEGTPEVEGASLIENVLFINALRTHLRSVNPNAYVVSEVLDGSIVYTQFYSGSDSLFNFDLASLVIDAATKGYSLSYLTRLESLYSDFAKKDRNFIDAPMLKNHDQDRLSEFLHIDNNIDNTIIRNKLAAAMYLLLPGNPFIYYGEEMGQFGYRVNALQVPGYGTAYDETRRLPLDWGDEYTPTWFVIPPGTSYTDRNSLVPSIIEQIGDENSLLQTYQVLGKLRQSNPALKYGNNFVPYRDASVLPSDNNQTRNSLMAYTRTYTQDDFSQSVLVMHNVSTTTDRAFLALPAYSKILYGQEDTYEQNERLFVKPMSTVVLELKDTGKK